MMELMLLLLLRKFHEFYISHPWVSLLRNFIHTPLHSAGMKRGLYEGVYIDGHRCDVLFGVESREIERKN